MPYINIYFILNNTARYKRYLNPKNLKEQNQNFFTVKFTKGFMTDMKFINNYLPKNACENCFFLFSSTLSDVSFFFCHKDAGRFNIKNKRFCWKKAWCKKVWW